MQRSPCPRLRCGFCRCVSRFRSSLGRDCGELLRVDRMLPQEHLPHLGEARQSRRHLLNGRCQERRQRHVCSCGGGGGVLEPLCIFPSHISACGGQLDEDERLCREGGCGTLLGKSRRASSLLDQKSVDGREGVLVAHREHLLLCPKALSGLSRLGEGGTLVDDRLAELGELLLQEGALRRQRLAQINNRRDGVPRACNLGKGGGWVWVWGVGVGCGVRMKSEGAGGESWGEGEGEVGGEAEGEGGDRGVRPRPR